MIKRIDKGRKWKYYRLTPKGKRVLNPHETKVWIVLATTIIALFATVYSLLSGLEKQFARQIKPAEKIADCGGGMDKSYSNMSHSVSDEVAGIAVGNTADNLTYLEEGVRAATTNLTTNEYMDILKGDMATTLPGDLIPPMPNDLESALTTTLPVDPESALTTTLLTDLKTTITTTMSDIITKTDTYATGAMGETKGINSPQIQDQVQSQLQTHIPTHIPYAELIAVILLTLIAGICAGYLIKKRRRI